jgi:hypothetical protein
MLFFFKSDKTKKEMDVFQQYQLPRLASERETEHINTCHLCARLYPLWIFHQGSPHDWVNLTEQKRRSMLPEWEQKHARFLKQFCKSKTHSAYQVFLAEHTRNQPTPVKDLIPLLAPKWQLLSPTERLPYEQQAQAMAQKHHDTIASWAKPFQKELKLMHTQMKNKRRNPAKTNRSPFIVWVQDRWREQKAFRNDYRAFLREMAQEWETSPERARYLDLTKRLPPAQPQPQTHSLPSDDDEYDA